VVVTVDGCIRYRPESSLRNRLHVRFFLGGGILACFHQVERDIDDHVLLAADHATPAKFHQDFARIDAVPSSGLLRVPQKARIHPA